MFSDEREDPDIDKLAQQYMDAPDKILKDDHYHDYNIRFMM